MDGGSQAASRRLCLRAMRLGAFAVASTVGRYLAGARFQVALRDILIECGRRAGEEDCLALAAYMFIVR